MTVDELLGFSEYKRDVLAEAKNFLTEQLEDEMVESNILYALAKEKNISERTIKTAKSELKIKSVREDGKWYFSME